MFSIKPTALAVALAMAPLASAFGASPTELAEIRAQINEMKAAYEQRIVALEKKLAQAEAIASRAETTAQAAQTTSQEIASSAASLRPTSGATAFNPEISLILDGKYTNTSQPTSSYRIKGFVPTGGEIAPPSRSFGLGESELALAANVDHMFRASARFSVAGDANEIATEEANIETLALPAGFKIKAGRFLSGIGYLNAQHPHEWDFVDAPLAYKAFFGSRLSNDGIQAKWLAPTPVFLEFGAEAARGGAYPDGKRDKNGTGLGAVFAHLGGDVGLSHAWQAGISFIKTNATAREFTETDSTGVDATNSFTGSSKTWVADMVWKWAPNGNGTHTNLKLQGEYFQRTEDGQLASNSNSGACGGACSGDFNTRQSGWYAQAVWQFMPKWRVGVRHDQLNAGTMDIGLVNQGLLATGDLPTLSSYAPKRNSIMADWSPSEFSRLRLQYGQDSARGEGLKDNQFFVQYIMSLGAHGAHKF